MKQKEVTKEAIDDFNNNDFYLDPLDEQCDEHARILAADLIEAEEAFLTKPERCKMTNDAPDNYACIDCEFTARITTIDQILKFILLNTENKFSFLLKQPVCCNEYLIMIQSFKAKTNGELNDICCKYSHY